MAKTVLVVDDEQMVRKLLEQVLKDVGLEVILCANGEEAFLHIGEADAIITDFDMRPGMSGVELAELAKAKRPELPVLIISADPYVPNDGLPADRLLTKPIKFMEMLKWLIEVLGE